MHHTIPFLWPIILVSSENSNLFLVLLSLPAGLDYTAISGMILTFTPSVNEINISVTITDDNLVEIDENFFGVLTTTASGIIIDPREAEVTILDRDSKLLRANHFSVNV